jgi:LAO/AO transport system kinase
MPATKRSSFAAWPREDTWAGSPRDGGRRARSDAAAKDVVVIETGGVGQEEVEIVRTADISIVTLVPGAGDDVQALKAGIMEIADIFVVNKADREGADRLVSSIEATLSLQSYEAGEWRPPILKTVASSGVGMTELMSSIDLFRQHAATKAGSATSRGLLAERRRARGDARFRDLLARQFVTHVENKLLAVEEFESIVDRIAARELDPYTAAAEVLGRALRSPNQLPDYPITRLPNS